MGAAVIWLIGGMALVIALLGAGMKMEHSGKVAAEAQVAERDAKIQAQNAAVATTKADGDRRVAEAKKGITRAATATQEARKEAERLRVASRNTPTKPGACPAGDAVAEVRKGL